MKRPAIVLVLSISTVLLASGCLWGVVTDADTGAAISGAWVMYSDSEGHTDSTTTNAGGWYAFDHAKGPVPAAGPISFKLTVPGRQPLTASRIISYDDNPNADNVSSLWEIQHFLVPNMADLAVSDIFPKTLPEGRVYARITNNGPDSVTDFDVLLGCSVTKTTTALHKTTKHIAPGFRTVNLNPGETADLDTHISLDTHCAYYDVMCEVQAPFNDPSTDNDTYQELIPQSHGDWRCMY